MEKDKKQSQQLKIEIDEKIGQGDYVNFAVVTHSLAEFIFAFVIKQSPINSSGNN